MIVIGFSIMFILISGIYFASAMEYDQKMKKLDLIIKLLQDKKNDIYK
jgi:hypothetical protein